MDMSPAILLRQTCSRRAGNGHCRPAQCLVCNKVHQTLDAAENCHKGPTQTIEQGLTGFSKRKGLIGN